MRAALALGLGALALAVWAAASGGPTAPDPGRPLPVAGPEGAAHLEPAARSAPPSLRGTTPSGGLAVDGAGHFVPDRAALLFFEHYLAATHEEPLPVVLARIRQAIAARLAPPAAAEAEAFLETFLDYRRAADAAFDDPALAEGVPLERRLQWLRELRREHFGAERAEALFGEEEDALRVRLAMRRVAADADLSPEERRAELRALEAELPQRIGGARARAVAPLRHAEAERALREAGASAAEIQALREEAFGPEAAARMAALDAERAEWQERMARYRSERDAILAREPDPGAALVAIERLRAERFPDPSLRERVRTLDRIESLAPDAPLP